jgi:hypothetical protein
MPMDDASMAQAAKPWSTNWRNAAAGAPGRAWSGRWIQQAGGNTHAQSAHHAHRASAGLSYLIAPAPATRRCWSCRWCRSRPARQRLVTGDPYQAGGNGPGGGLEAMQCAAMRSPVKAEGLHALGSTRQAQAPRASASATWARPSVAAPGQAMKPSPGARCGCRSASVPVTRSRSHATASAGWCSIASERLLHRVGHDLRLDGHVGLHAHHAQGLLHHLAEHRRGHQAAVVHCRCWARRPSRPR